MTGRTWKNIKDIESIKKYLLEIGGVEERGNSSYELFRIKFPFSVFTFYKNGTLYSTPSDALELLEIWNKIDSILGGRFVPPTKDYLLGMDETGKGEIIGPLILVGVIFKKEIFKKIDHIVGSADTKVRHDFEYWDKIFKELISLDDFHYTFLEISPKEIDEKNINHLLDEGYKKILENLLRGIDSSEVRIVIDDYGVGKNLIAFLKNLNSEVIIETHSEEKYLETRTASIVSKRIREEKMKKLREKYKIEDLTFGSGNLEDRNTLEWLKKWRDLKRGFPPIVRKSFLKKIERNRPS